MEKTEKKQLLTLNEVKKIEIDILNYLKQICEENNLTYFLSYGSLLGAVRHKGFIPWDDDIDIVMPRNDYNKFLEFFKNNNTKYKLINHQFDKKYIHLFSKLVDDNYICKEENIIDQNYGIFIDIFPLEGAGRSEKEAIKTCKKFEFYQKLIWYNLLKKFPKSDNKIKDIFRFIFYLYSKVFGVEKSHKKYNKFVKKYNYDDNEYLSVNYAYKILSKKEIGKGTKVFFEGEEYNTFNNYHNVLVKQFGNSYMQLPPESERITHNLAVYKKQ